MITVTVDSSNLKCSGVLKKQGLILGGVLVLTKKLAVTSFQFQKVIQDEWCQTRLGYSVSGNGFMKYVDEFKSFEKHQLGVLMVVSSSTLISRILCQINDKIVLIIN